MIITNIVEDNGNKLVCIHCTTNDAIRLIKSLANQIVEDSPNSGRMETYCEDGTYFSIGVHKSLEHLRHED